MHHLYTHQGHDSVGAGGELGVPVADQEAEVTAPPSQVGHEVAGHLGDRGPSGFAVTPRCAQRDSKFLAERQIPFVCMGRLAPPPPELGPRGQLRRRRGNGGLPGPALAARASRTWATQAATTATSSVRRVFAKGSGATGRLPKPARVLRVENSNLHQRAGRCSAPLAPVDRSHRERPDRHGGRRHGLAVRL